MGSLCAVNIKEKYLKALPALQLIHIQHIWHLTRACKLIGYPPVPNGNHLVEEKVIPVHGHLPNNRLKPAKPDVDLFCDRRVESPGTIKRDQFGKVRRVAVRLTVRMGLGMLAGEVEYIHRKSHAIQEISVRITMTLHVWAQVTVVVVTGVSWNSKRVFVRKGTT